MSTSASLFSIYCTRQVKKLTKNSIGWTFQKQTKTTNTVNYEKKKKIKIGSGVQSQFMTPGVKVAATQVAELKVKHKKKHLPGIVI